MNRYKVAVCNMHGPWYPESIYILDIDHKNKVAMFTLQYSYTMCITYNGALEYLNYIKADSNARILS